MILCWKSFWTRLNLCLGNQPEDFNSQSFYTDPVSVPAPIKRAWYQLIMHIWEERQSKQCNYDLLIFMSFHANRHTSVCKHAQMSDSLRVWVCLWELALPNVTTFMNIYRPFWQALEHFERKEGCSFHLQADYIAPYSRALSCLWHEYSMCACLCVCSVASQWNWKVGFWRKKLFTIQTFNQPHLYPRYHPTEKKTTP